MKKWCVWLLALCVSQGAAAQDSEAGECVFHTGLEQYPTFMGGDLTEFRAWVYRNIRYPREAFDRGEQGRILVSFVIDTLGNVTQVGPLSAAARGDEECGKESPGTDERYKELLPERKAGPIGISESPALVREAVRVVRSSPRWAPARMGGGIANSAKVPVEYSPSDRLPAEARYFAPLLACRRASRRSGARNISSAPNRNDDPEPP